MRPEGRGELDSLYFNYPHFDAPSGNNRNTLSEQTQVAVVGAGPVGLTAALTLAKYGVPSVIFEKGATFNDGSRAICVARQSFHIFESLNAVQPFVSKALGWTMGRSFYRGHQILEFEMPDSADEKYRPMYNLEQQYIEQFLWQAAEASPLIDIRWQSELVKIEDRGEGVQLTISDAIETYTLIADWVLAADGARSPIRNMRGLQLKGDAYEGRYVIADVQMEHNYPTIRRALFDPNCRPGGTVLVHRQPDNIWRIDYQLTDDEDPEQAVREEVVRESVLKVLNDINHSGKWELEWWSTYTANTLALDDYRDGRIFFIGDSAHIVPIFGVRGLNNGIADSQNIGWKLAWVIQGIAGRGLLDTYSQERRGATLEVFANASKSTRFMTPPTRGWQVMRDATLSLALTQAYAGELANPRQMIPHVYAGGPITLADTDRFDSWPVPGAVAINARTGDGFLSDQFGEGFTLLDFGCGLDLRRALNNIAAPVTVISLDADSSAGRIYNALEGTSYLIRPDMHIAARWLDPAAETVRAAISKILHIEEAV